MRLSAPAASAISELDRMWGAVAKARELQHGGAVIARPEGCFTVAEYIERFGGSDSNVRNTILPGMEKAGLMKRIRIYSPDKAGRNVVTNAWLPVAR